MAGKGKGYGAEVMLALTLNKEDNTIQLPQSPKISRLLHSLTNDDGEVEVRVRQIKYKRTDAQNRYYWGVAVVLIMKFFKEATGEVYTREQVHAYNLQELNTVKPSAKEITNPKTGEVTTVYYIEGKTTSQMNTLEFTEFIAKLQRFWAELDLVIPDPKPKANNYLTDFIK